MKKIAFSISWFLFFPLIATGQKSVSEMHPAHASALQEFLTTHPDLDFLSEKSIDEDYLKGMRKYLGARLTPYYCKGNFNGDRYQDFAVILMKDAPPEKDPDLAESHRYRYQLTVAVFNGMKGGKHKAVFIRTVTAPLVSFLNTTGGRKKRLYFGVFETDEAFGLTPAGKGYIAEY